MAQAWSPVTCPPAPSPALSPGHPSTPPGRRGTPGRGSSEITWPNLPILQITKLSYKEAGKVTRSLSDRAGPRSCKAASARAGWDGPHRRACSLPSREACGAVRARRLAEVREAAVGHAAGEEQDAGQTRPPGWPSLLLPLPDTTPHDTGREWKPGEGGKECSRKEWTVILQRCRCSKCLQRTPAALRRGVRKRQTP